MTKQDIINDKILARVSDYVKGQQLGEGTGHDWWHTYRVLKTTQYIAKKENANIFIASLAALLHDIADWKFNNGDEKAGSKAARTILGEHEISPEVIDHVCYIIDNISYKGSVEENKINTIEGLVVQDADRLDALGAIGIARTFAYGGSDGREIYNPNNKPKDNMNFEEYKRNKGSSINHFYEKLLLLKDKLNTETAKLIAEDRHEYMIKFLDEFYKEWDVKYQ